MRCNQQIYNAKTYKFRKCRRNCKSGSLYCFQHTEHIDHEDDPDVGTCCFCGGECNPSSQACGRCPREIGGWLLGFRKEKPPFL